jgi:hypothetical protein
MPTTRSTTGASAWKCHRCNHANDTVRNKKRCFSCRSWKDGIAPLSASARGVVLDNKAGVELRDNGIDRSIDEPPAAATDGRGGVTTILQRSSRHVVAYKPSGMVCHHSGWTGSRSKHRKCGKIPEIPMLQRVQDAVYDVECRPSPPRTHRLDIFVDARENDSPNTKKASCRMAGTTSGH